MGHSTSNTQGAVGAPARSDIRELNFVPSLLREVSLFASLSESDLAELARTAIVTEYEQGATIVAQGDAGRSLLIVASGVVEVALDGYTGERLRLCTVERGGYFGEMSLFDGSRRSANAIALSACVIIELPRTALEAMMSAELLRTLLVETAGRVRRTDVKVREFADKIHRSANANAQAAVSVELDSIKTLYQRTGQLSAHALARAEEVSRETLARTEARAAEVLARAEGTRSDLEQQIARAYALLTKRVAPIATVVVLVAGWLGLRSLDDITKKLAEVNASHTAVQTMERDIHAALDRVRSLERSLRIVQETTIDLRGMREAAGLGQVLRTPQDLERVALSYEPAKREVLRRYIWAEGAGPQHNTFEVEVVLEAVDTYVSLARGGRSDGQLTMPRETRGQLLSALAYVLRNSLESDDASGSSSAAWLLDRKLRDLIAQLAEGVDDRQRAVLRGELKEALEQPRSQRALENAALVLAELGTDYPAVVEALTAMTKQQERAWRGAQAALGLARLGHAEGFEELAARLSGSAEVAYPVASVLAKPGALALRQLAARFHQLQRIPELERLVRAALSEHRPRKCHEQRYAHWLAACFDGTRDEAVSQQLLSEPCAPS